MPRGGASPRTGTKPKPPAIKLREGNLGRRPINHREPQYPSTLPPAPDELDQDAKAEWERGGALLVGQRVVTEGDLPILTMYCAVWSQWLQAQRALMQHGLMVVDDKGAAKISPWFTVAEKTGLELRRVAAELGLTPSSRARLQVDPQHAQKETHAEKIFGF